nr:receptor-like protein EIX1 [Ziziphus jujuba var. spinosa]
MHSTTLPWLLNVSSNLINLAIWEDEITGPAPDYIGNIKSLQNIDLITDSHGGIPKSMENLCNLRSLELYYSEGFFNGTLEDILESLSGCATKSLEILRVEYSEVGGSLLNLSQFSSMRELHLGENNVNGSLRKSIGQLSNLEVLDVSSNYFTGAVFEGHLQNLSKLQYLDLSSNNFTGVVSDAHLRKLSKLRYLALSSNSFTLHLDSKWIPPFQLVAMKLRS